MRKQTLPTLYINNTSLMFRTAYKPGVGRN